MKQESDHSFFTLVSRNSHYWAGSYRLFDYHWEC